VAWRCSDLNKERDQLKLVHINVRIILKVYLKETGWSGKVYIHWAQNRYHLQADMNMVINLQIM